MFLIEQLTQTLVCFLSAQMIILEVCCSGAKA